MKQQSRVVRKDKKRIYAREYTRKYTARPMEQQFDVIFRERIYVSIASRIHDSCARTLYHHFSFLLRDH